MASYTPADLEAHTLALLGPDVPTDIDANIPDQISHAILGLWPYIWKGVEWPITPDPALTVWYELPQDFMDVSQVTQMKNDDKNIGYYGSRKTRKPIFIGRNMPSEISNTGLAVKFPGGMYSTDNDIYVWYRAKITETLTNANIYADIQSPPLEELIVYSAAVKITLLQTHERVNSNDTTMWDQTIQAKDRLSLWQVLSQELKQLRTSYHEELMLTCPPSRRYK